MTRPYPYLIRMLLFLVAVGLLSFFLSSTLLEAFDANAALNGLILGVMVLGVVYIVLQAQLLNREVRWIEKFRVSAPGASTMSPPRLLAPMATMLGEHRNTRGDLRLSPVSMRSILDSVGSRLDESRDISRYLIGLLIFLGLLGTFWGLIKTLTAVSGTLDTLNAGASDNIVTLFDNLKAGLAAPLSGMGTAFSSSLFGLAGSLVLGFLDLQSSQAQNRFYNQLEEWLSTITRVQSGPGLGSDGDQSVPAYVSALLEQTADSLDRLQRTLEKSEETRMGSGQQIVSLTEKLTGLTDLLHDEQRQLSRLVDGQQELRQLLEQYLAVSSRGGFDQSSRDHLRNLDVSLDRLVTESSNDRSALVGEIRSEIRLLARTIAAARSKE